MTFSAFLMGVGMVGTAFLAGVIIRSFWIREKVAGTGLWLAAMVFMGTVAAVASVSEPLIEPLWLQYALLLGAPFILGFVGLMILTRRHQATDSDQ